MDRSDENAAGHVCVARPKWIYLADDGRQELLQEIPEPSAGFLYQRDDSDPGRRERLKMRRALPEIFVEITMHFIIILVSLFFYNKEKKINDDEMQCTRVKEPEEAQPGPQVPKTTTPPISLFSGWLWRRREVLDLLGTAEAEYSILLGAKTRSRSA